MECRSEFSGSRKPASWRNPHITCSKEEAITQLRAIRNSVIASGVNPNVFRSIASRESDCSRWEEWTHSTVVPVVEAT